MAKFLFQMLTYAEPAACAVALLGILRSQSVRKFAVLTALLTTRTAATIACLILMQCMSHGWISESRTYDIYFYLYWSSFAGQSLFSLYIILSIFRMAMAPLQGLQKLGMVVFRWAAAVSVALALVSGLGPSHSSALLVISFVSHFNQIASVLTLCLLLFVCYAIHPLGLNFRSREFGVSIGLGIAAAGNLLAAAWAAHSKLDSAANLLGNAASVICVLTWGVYFFLPEAKRRIIVLPTTSPFLRWNQISEALGDDPGFVAIAGVPPEVFAPAELEIMARASAMMSTKPVTAPSLRTPVTAHAEPLSA